MWIPKCPPSLVPYPDRNHASFLTEFVLRQLGVPGFVESPWVVLSFLRSKWGCSREGGGEQKERREGEVAEYVKWIKINLRNPKMFIIVTAEELLCKHWLYWCFLGIMTRVIKFAWSVRMKQISKFFFLQFLETEDLEVAYIEGFFWMCAYKFFWIFKTFKMYFVHV